MGAKPSKDELLYQQVDYGNVERIRALHSEGAGLEWMDKEGKTPLILACMMPDFLPVVKVLIDLGANVNAHRPGSYAGTPLHRAADRGSVQTVKLLLDHGANPLLRTRCWQSPLDIARANNHRKIVRLIESRICLFAGWLRELHGSSIVEPILEVIAPQWVTRKIWAVILPRDPTHELAIYSDRKAARPNPVILLRYVQITEPNWNQLDPAIVIVDKATKKRYKFLSENEGDKQQLQWFRNACRGIPPHNTYAPPMVSLPSAPPIVEETFQSS